MQQQPQQPKSKRKKRANRSGILASAAAGAPAAVGAGPQTARAIVVPTPPPPAAKPTATPTGTPNSTVLPLDSSLFFVLDDTISSRLQSGTVVHAHLRDPIVLAGKTVAAAGAPVEIQVFGVTPAHMGNEDGSVDIYFMPLTLANGRSIPLTTPTGHIDPHVSVGQYNTRAAVDTAADIFIPGHYIYHLLRKGHDVTLGPGTVLRARTGASLMIARGGALVVATPQPFLTVSDTPHPAFSPAPLVTPPGFHLPTPKPSPSVKPTSTP